MLDDAAFLPFNAIVYRSIADYSRLLTLILKSNASHVEEDHATVCVSNQGHSIPVVADAACDTAGLRSNRDWPSDSFSFDDHTIPFKDNLFLTMVQATKYPGNPIVPQGPAGAPDAHRAQFYGTVIHVGNRYRMWYAAASDATEVDSHSPAYRPAYAESTDGIHWNKPSLGLVEFNGNKNNNLLSFTPKPNFALSEPLYVAVLYEPSDPDSSRRYKMALYGRFYRQSDPEHKKPKSTIYPYFSADGLHWKLALPTPKGETFNETEEPLSVRQIFEIGGLYKFDGLYYVAGQELWDDVAMPDGEKAGRMMITHWSSDFVHWSRDSAISFMRYGYRSIKENKNEAHEPAAVWNRNNVLLGTFGLWEDAKNIEDRRMPLGFLVSNDGIHFREPQPDFAILQPGPTGAWDQHGLIHGQGFENVGDQTYIYYGTWDLSSKGDPPGGIGLATIRRDGFGYLSVRRDGAALLTTIPLELHAGVPHVSINSEGLSKDATLRVELLDKNGNPVQGYSAAAPHSGVDETVQWTQSASAIKAGEYRLRLYFEGSGRDQICFYAAYIK